jgi:hypothetical protein
MNKRLRRVRQSGFSARRHLVMPLIREPYKSCFSRAAGYRLIALGGMRSNPAVSCRESKKGEPEGAPF